MPFTDLVTDEDTFVSLTKYYFRFDIIKSFSSPMSWHTPDPCFAASSSGLSSRPVFGIEISPPLPGTTDPHLVTCVLCPEPGLVPASMMSYHLLREHQGMAFQCAACKVRARVSIK